MRGRVDALPLQCILTGPSTRYQVPGRMKQSTCCTRYQVLRVPFTFKPRYSSLLKFARQLYQDVSTLASSHHTNCLVHGSVSIPPWFLPQSRCVFFPSRCGGAPTLLSWGNSGRRRHYCPSSSVSRACQPMRLSECPACRR